VNEKEGGKGKPHDFCGLPMKMFNRAEGGMGKRTPFRLPM